MHDPIDVCCFNECTCEGLSILLMLSGAYEHKHYSVHVNKNYQNHCWLGFEQEP